MPLTATNSPNVRRKPRAPMATESPVGWWSRRSGNGGTRVSPARPRRIATKVFSSVGDAVRTLSTASPSASRTARSPDCVSRTSTSRRSPKRWTSAIPSRRTSVASAWRRSVARTSRRCSPRLCRSSAGVPVREALHAEHREIALPTPFDLPHGHAPQLADVAQVLRHAEVLIEAERLREVADVLARLSRRLTEQIGGAGRRLHHAAQDLERRGLSRDIRPDEPEDLARPHVQVDAPHRLDGAVALGQRASADRDARGCHRRACCVGQSPPSTRISPSAGMPGFAKPTALLSRSFTPTTCL